MGAVLNKSKPAFVAAALVTATAATAPAAATGATASTRLPTYFLSHAGGPSFWMETKPHERGGMSDLMRKMDTNSPIANWFRAHFASTKQFPQRPKAVLMISGHWETDHRLSVYSMEENSMYYDYGGFGADMFKIKYPAKGSPALASRVQQLLSKGGFPCDLEHERGLDHGAFNCLHVMYPKADIPVVQLSLLSSMRSDEHIKIGQLLAPLRDEGILIAGSGDLTHVFPNSPSIHTHPNFAKEFDSYIESILLDTKLTPAQRNEKLAKWRSHPVAKIAHPTADHFMPMLVVAGAASGDTPTVAVPAADAKSDKPLVAGDAAAATTTATAAVAAASSDAATKVYDEFPVAWWSLGCYRFG